MMSAELMDKVQLLEKEKSELFAMHLKKQSELENVSRNDLDRLKESNKLVDLLFYISNVFSLTTLFTWDIIWHIVLSILAYIWSTYRLPYNQMSF